MDIILRLRHLNRGEISFFLKSCFNFRKGLPRGMLRCHELSVSFFGDVWRWVPKFWDYLMEILDFMNFHPNTFKRTDNSQKSLKVEIRRNYSPKQLISLVTHVAVLQAETILCDSKFLRKTATSRFGSEHHLSTLCGSNLLLLQYYVRRRN